MAVVVTHPIDQTKVRAQTQLVRQTMVQTFRSTYRNSGVLGLWIRLSGSLLRQATYGVARFGIYAWLKDRDQRLQGGSQSSASGWHLVKNGAISGLFAGLVGAPGGEHEQTSAIEYTSSHQFHRPQNWSWSDSAPMVSSLLPIDSTIAMLYTECIGSPKMRASLECFGDGKRHV